MLKTADHPSTKAAYPLHCDQSRRRERLGHGGNSLQGGIWRKENTMSRLSVLFLSIAVLVCSLVVALPKVMADTVLGTPEEAKALAEEAAAHYKKVGREKALADFNDKQGKFVKKDLYIFVIDTDGNTLAHGDNPKLIGKNLLEVKDLNGVYFFKEFIKTAKDGEGKGWVTYQWPHPDTKKPRAKASYIIRVEDKVLLGCGAYK
jgi:hypothetical protein